MKAPNWLCIIGLSFGLLFNVFGLLVSAVLVFMGVFWLPILLFVGIEETHLTGLLVILACVTIALAYIAGYLLVGLAVDLGRELIFRSKQPMSSRGIIIPKNNKTKNDN